MKNRGVRRAEPTPGAGALLSWRAVPGAASYQIWRADVNPILVRDDINVEAWQIVFKVNSPCDWQIAPGVRICNKIPDKYVGPYSQIATTQNASFVDTTVAAGKTYMYYVTVGTQTGPMSDQSNLVTFPVLMPAMTFAEELRQIGKWNQRQRFKSVSLRNELILQVLVADIQAMRCQLAAAVTTLNAQPASRYLLDPDAADLEVITAKLTRRLTLYQQAPQNMITTEFCTSP